MNAFKKERHKIDLGIIAKKNACGVKKEYIFYNLLYLLYERIYLLYLLTIEWYVEQGAKSNFCQNLSRISVVKERITTIPKISKKLTKSYLFFFVLSYRAQKK